MATNPFTLTVHMVSSLDGFIAKKDNSVSWFETPDTYDKGVDGQDTEGFLKTIGCYLMGSKTYELAVELSKSYGWPYGDKPTIVVSRRKLAPERPNIEVYAGDLDKLVNERLKSTYANAWLVGGAQLTKEFIRLGLVDDIRMTILPIMLGEGLPFFDQVAREIPLHLKDVTAYKNGMVELWYGVKK